MFGKRIGVDLGTANCLVYVKGRGIVSNEPSVVAVAQRDNSIVAVGQEARDMLGRTPGAIQVIRPMREGVIADYITTEAMLRHFIGRVIGRFSLIKPEVMICVPAGVTGVEQRAVQDAAEAAVISMYGIVVTESVRVAGDRLDDAIANHVKRRHNIIIGDRTAEDLKIAIGSALPMEEELTYQVRGRDQISGLPRTITVTSTDITQGIQDSLSSIVGACRTVLERTPPELASDVVDRGIVLTGGTSLLRNLDRLITQEIGISCYVADNPLECVAMGAGIALDHLELIKRSMPAEGEWLVSF